MSLGARLLASGALGTVSGIILAAGMLALLSGPAHAQTAASPDHPPSIAVAAQDSGSNSLLGGRSTTRLAPAADASRAEAVPTSIPAPTHSGSSSTTPTRQGNSALVLNGSLHLK